MQSRVHRFELKMTTDPSKMSDVRILSVPILFGWGRVNCYLLEAAGGFILIDTGSRGGRSALDRELAKAGCAPGSLRLVVLTHGDFDHIGNAAYLRDRYGATLAMGRDDGGMAERGDMFWNRSSGSALLRSIVPILFGFPKTSRFTPSLCLEHGDLLSEFGLDARIISLPGHSRGSIGVLTAAGDLFCGDLLVSSGEPAVNSIMDDPAACRASLRRLQALDVVTVYPGHGRPFPAIPFLAQLCSAFGTCTTSRSVI